MKKWYILIMGTVILSGIVIISVTGKINLTKIAIGKTKKNHTVKTVKIGTKKIFHESEAFNKAFKSSNPIVHENDFGTQHLQQANSVINQQRQHPSDNQPRFPNRKIIDSEDTELPDGTIQRNILAEIPDFKYDKIKIIEYIDPKTNRVLSSKEMVATHFLLKVNKEISKKELEYTLQGSEFTVLKQIPSSNIYLISCPSNNLNDLENSINTVASDLTITVYAEPDYIGHTSSVSTNDPKFNEQWALNNIGATSAWNTTTGSNNIVVGVLDTGVDYTHPDLVDNIWHNQGEDWIDSQTPGNNGIDDDNNGYIDDYYGIDAFYGDSEPMDKYDHGTSCAGIIGVVANNNLGTAGINWNVKIMPLQVYPDNGYGSTTSAGIECINYATKMGVDIFSASWLVPYSQSLKDTIQESGKLLCAAAGNDGYDLDNDGVEYYPAMYDLENVISVAATDSDDELTYWSCYGATKVDLAAPGSNTIAPSINNSYRYFGGTSGATPHVAGAAALILSAKLDATPGEIKQLLIENTDPQPSLIGKCISGGRLNVNNALNASGSSSDTNKAPILTFLEPSDNSTIKQITLSPITVEFNSYDLDGSIISDKIKVDSKEFTGNTATWTPSSFGNFTIEGEATDNNNTVTKKTINVTIVKINNTVDISANYSGSQWWGNLILTIQNNGTEAIDGWELEFDFPYSITWFSGAAIKSHNDNTYNLTPNAWGGGKYITPGETVTISGGFSPAGFIPGDDKLPSTFIFNGIEIGDTPENNSPIANDDNNITVTAGESIPINVLNNDSDPDGDTISIISISNSLLKGTASISGDTIIYEAFDNVSGTEEFEYIISDENGGTDSATVYITINEKPNTPPTVTIAEPVDGTIIEQENLSEVNIVITPLDSDGSIVSSEITVDNKIFNGETAGWIPSAFGTYEIIARVKDNKGAEATASSTITIKQKIIIVNKPPTISFVTPIDGQIFEQKELSPINIEVNAEDPDGGNVDVTIDINNETFSGTTASWTPKEFKTYSITASAQDDEGETATVLISFTVKEKVPAQKQIIGYMDQWSCWKNQNDHGVPKGGLNHTNIDWSKYTIVNFSFFGLANDGSLHSAEYRNKDMETIDSIANAEFDKKGYDPDIIQEPGKLIFRDHAWSFDPYFFDNDPNGVHKNMFEYAKENDVKLLASIGGWSMCKHFAEVAADSSKRAKFVADCIKLIDMGFDGIDLDWEYPGNEGRNITNFSDEDYTNFTILVREIKEAIGSDKLLTSCFCCDINKLEGFEWTEINSYLDYFNVMSYDMNGGWSEKTGHLAPLYAADGKLSWNNVFAYLTETAGIESEKINMGIPFYGRGVITDGTADLNVNTFKEYKPFDVDGYLYMAHDFDNFAAYEGAPYYSFIKQKTGNWTEKWDETSKTPYKIKDNYFLSFENEASIAAKAKYVVDHDAGGVIIFGAYGDIDFTNASEEYSYGDKEIIQKYSGLKTPLLDVVYSIFENGGGNIKPEVEITEPSDGHIVITDELSELAISGNSYDPDGTIESIYAEIDNKVYDITLTDGSFTFSWTPASFGSYEIKVTAEDNSGAVSTVSISVIVKQTGSVTDDKIIIGYMNQWDAWKAPDKFDILPAKGAYNHLNVDMNKYDIINFSFFGVANDGSLHSGDLKVDNLYLDSVTQYPADLVHMDQYSSYDTYFFYGDTFRDIWWVSQSDAEYLEELAIEWTSSTWTDPVTGEIKSYPIKVPKGDRVKNMFECAHESGAKILASIGGWTMCKHFAQIAADPVKRATFVDDCKTLLKMGFDGIDLDWEYPGNKGMNILDYSDEDYHNFTLLVKEIREAIGNDKLLTSCFSCDIKKLQKLEWNELTNYLNYFNIMSYDMDGGWSDNTGHNSSLYNDDDKHSWDKVFKYLTQTAGIESKKINMGIAFYGRSVETNGPASLGAPTYKTNKEFYIDGPLYMAHDFVNFGNYEGAPYYTYIVEHTKDWTEYWDDKAKVPYKVKDNFFLSYDNEESVRLKAEYVVDNNAAGVIIWQVYNDIDFSNAVKVAENEKIQQYSNLKTPLLDVIYNTFMNYSAWDQQPVVNITTPVSGTEIIQEQLAPVHISINAYDPDGGNVSVTIEVDDQVFNATSADWMPSSFGTFTITATVTDDENNTQNTYSNVIIKEDTGTSEAPIISFISPIDNAVIEQEVLSPVTVKVNASDPDGSVESVIIEIDEQTFNGNTVNWMPSNFGTFNIKATATDNDNISTSKSINVEIKQDQSGSSEAPIVSIISHTNGETIELEELAPINIEIDASDPDGGDVSIAVEVDGQTFNGSNISWTPSDFGTYNINVTVTDDENQTADLLFSLIIKKKDSSGGTSVVKGWPAYIAMGAVTGGFKDDHANRPVDALFKYAGDGGNGDRGSIKYPIYTKNISSMTQELKADYNKNVLPVMVVYTAEMSGGTNFGDLHDYDNLTMHFINLIHTCKILQGTKSTDNPYPGSIVLNPDLLGMVQQNNLLGSIDSQAIRVQDALYKAIHCVEDKVDYNGSMMNPLEIFAELRQDAWSDWDIKNTWEQLIQNDIFPFSSETAITGIPSFSNDFKGWIQATNFVIKHYSPDVTFGWQENLWSRGSAQWIHRDYTEDEIKDTICSGTIDLWSELDIYSGQYKPDFIVFDKYERDPIPDFITNWLFNDRDWDNYLEYVKQISISLGDIPVMLWQLPGGHLQIDGDVDTRTSNGATAPVYFFGDENLDINLTNLKSYISQSVKDYLTENGYDWRQQGNLQKALECNVFAMLWGGGSTTSVGTYPSDDGGWLSNKINNYYTNPVYLDDSGTENRAPVANTDSISLYPGEMKDIDVLSNDNDPDGDALTITTVSNPLQGTVSMTDSLITYAAKNDASDQDSFTYTITDGNGHKTTGTVNVTILSDINNPPQASDDSLTLYVDETKTIDVLANDSDADNDPLTIIDVHNNSNLGNPIISNNKIEYTAYAAGTHNFSYTVSDGIGGTDSGNVSVTINEQQTTEPGEFVIGDVTVKFEAASVWWSDYQLTGTVSGNASKGWTMQINFDNGQTVNTAWGIASKGSGTNEVINNSWSGATGTFTASVSGTHSYAGELPSSIVFNGVSSGGEEPENQAPVAVTDTASVNSGNSVTIDVLNNDYDSDDDALVISEVTQGSKGNVQIITSNNYYHIIYTANQGSDGTDSFLYTIDDGNGGEDTATVNINITASGNISPEVTFSTPSDGQVILQETLSPVEIQIDPKDEDGTIVSVEIDVDNQIFTETSVQWTPSAFGEHNIIATATDNEGATAIATITVIIKNSASSESPKEPLVVGYWHNWENTQAPYIRLKDVNPKYNVIDISFAEPTSSTDMTMQFSPAISSKTEFISDIQTLQANGTKVLISIGGANAHIRLNTTEDRDKFISSMIDIIDEYSFDGLDIDFEGGALSVESSDFTTPISALTVNTIDAVKEIIQYFKGQGQDFWVTAAPETAYLQGALSAYGGTWGAYIPLLYALGDDLTYVAPQLYNTGSMLALDGKAYAKGNADFIVAMTECLTEGMTINGRIFKLRPDQVVIGLPATPAAAYNNGSYIAPNEVIKALDYLINGESESFEGSYILRNPEGYSELRGMMTWSVNWDNTNDGGTTVDEFAETYYNYFNGSTGYEKELIANNDSVNTLINTPITIAPITNDTAPIGITPIIVSITQPTSGSVSYTDTEITYTPNTDFFGTDSFEYTISDNNSNTDSAVVTVYIQNNNTSSGAIYYHLTFPVDIQGSQTAEALVLDEGNYNDLIMSNYVAGALLGHLVRNNEKYGKIKFSRDYLYGSIFGQLLQENISTSSYSPSTNWINTDASIREILLSPGQGGPYQINDYAKRLGGDQASGGLGLINYAVLQKNLGFKIADQDNNTQTSRRGPDKLEDKYFGPMATTYFHYNSLNRLDLINTPTWGPSYQYWTECMSNLESNLDDNFFDMIINAAYNAGPWSDIIKTYIELGAKVTDASFETQQRISNINNYLLSDNEYRDAIDTNASSGSTFIIYPRQIRFYCDEFYNNPGIQDFHPTSNTVIFNQNVLQDVFAKSMSSLAYVNSDNQYEFISYEDAAAAYENARETLGFKNISSLDLGNSLERNNIFDLLDTAINNLAANLNFDFATVTETDLDQ